MSDGSDILSAVDAWEAELTNVQSAVIDKDYDALRQASSRSGKQYHIIHKVIRNGSIEDKSLRTRLTELATSWLKIQETMKEWMTEVETELDAVTAKNKLKKKMNKTYHNFQDTSGTHVKLRAE